MGLSGLLLLPVAVTRDCTHRCGDWCVRLLRCHVKEFRESRGSRTRACTLSRVSWTCGECGPLTASLRRGTGAPWVSLPGPTSVMTRPGRMPSHQSANNCACVGRVVVRDHCAKSPTFVRFFHCSLFFIFFSCFPLFFSDARNQIFFGLEWPHDFQLKLLCKKHVFRPSRGVGTPWGLLIPMFSLVFLSVSRVVLSPTSYVSFEWSALPCLRCPSEM